jgi:ribulose-phosphate 3-epimerase
VRQGIKGVLKKLADMKVKIVPTILTQNFAEFKKRLKQIEPFFKLVQIDCEDGKFVGNKTFYDKSKVESLKSKVNFELHLMIKEPLKEIKKWLGYKNIKRVIFHYEAVKNYKEILEIINYLHKKGIKAGLAINLETKVEKVLKILSKLDVLLIMGVKPGRGGQKISLKVVKLKVYKVRKMYPKLDIEVDGGVNLQNAQELVKAGTNILAVGTSLKNKKDYQQFLAIINN